MSARHQGGGEGYSHVVCLIDHTLYHTTPGGYPDAASEKAMSPREDSGVRHIKVRLSPERLSGALQMDRPEFDSCLSHLSCVALGKLLKFAHL